MQSLIKKHQTVLMQIQHRSMQPTNITFPLKKKKTLSHVRRLQS